ncbi:Protein translocase subunit SecD [hydrothermal vent metagenome]|uniref:Protein translocase subunit SecD n=1 Tax=hydrothermal vent metagenome TaxID=652676 RepID=A0A3B0WR50_9ZZZZ
MLNQYPIWKYILLIVVLVLSSIFALPNLYGEDPAVQISHRTKALTDADKLTVEQVIEAKNISILNTELEQGRLLVRFENTESQLIAASALKEGLDKQYLIALNLAPATPDWLRALSAAPMYLGLDLRGGVHFLMEVDMVAAIKRLEESMLSDIKTYLREEKIRYRGVRRNDTGLHISFRELAHLQQASEILPRQFKDLTFSDDEATLSINAKLTEAAVREEKKSALQQNIVTLRNRVNELGVAEPVIQQQGNSRIVVQLPGIQDTAGAKKILGATATLEFRMAEGTRTDWTEAERTGRTPLNAVLYHERDGSPVLLNRRVIVTGDQIVDAASTFDSQKGTPAVTVRLNGKGADKMGDITRVNLGNPMGVVFIENKVETKKVGDTVTKHRTTTKEVINVATIQGQFSSRFQITGLESQEARDLALLLRAGSLRAPVEIIEERTVGPSLGRDNIEKGFMSVVIGFCLVLVFMAIYYKGFGLIANIALTANLIIIIAVLSLLQATLTLPGIAGIVLTVGMAVDANVLIFERIKEEIKNGNSPQASIHAGYEKAFSTITDANVTTLLAAIVLFMLGAGPIKGFAITLCIGILTSMFTAIVGTRAIVNLLYGNREIKKLSI